MSAEPFTVEQLTLTARKFGATHRMSRQVLDAMTIEVAQDIMCDSLTFMLQARIYGAPGEQTVEVTRDVPASPWQAFKLRAIAAGNPFFQPERVRYVTERSKVTGDLFSWWPDLDMPMPSSAGAPIRLLTQARAKDYWRPA